jgi:hypothetical protein
MRANAFFSLLLSLTVKISLPLFFFMLISGFRAKATDTIVTVKYDNPKYVCSTQTYTLEVKFQCNVSGFQLNGMNVRFIYAEDVLEFTSFSNFASSYRKYGTPTVYTSPDTSGMARFGLPGSYEFINATVQKYTSTNVWLPTSGWVRLFNINFHVDDPNVVNDPDFCPSAIWDLKENPAEGGMHSPGGIVINLVMTYGGTMYSCTENVIQFNWQYDTIPGEPFGFPVNTTCIPTQQTYSPTNYLPVNTFEEPGPVDIPVIVTNFAKIGHFNLVFEYDPAFLTYVNNTPNTIFTTQNGLLYVTDSVSTGGKNKITMKYQRQGTVALTLSDSAVLTNLHFIYITGTSDLTWKTSNNTCHYVDSLLLPKCDQPYSDYYLNGNINLADFIWTGAISDDWNTGSNWLYNIIPNEYSNVIIDPSMAITGWPVYTGNFTLGAQCKNLTLLGDAELSISGDLNIESEYTLNIEDSGILKVGGNWTNSGTFNHGNGTVEFTGTMDGIIAEGIPPTNTEEVFHKLIITKFPGKLYIQKDVRVTGLY